MGGPPPREPPIYLLSAKAFYGASLRGSRDGGHRIVCAVHAVTLAGRIAGLPRSRALAFKHASAFGTHLDTGS